MEHEQMCSDPDATILAELAALRQRVAELEAEAAERERLLAQVQPGQVPGAAGWHDMADSRQTEKVLGESEHKFRSVVERSGDGIVLADEQGAIVEWNQAQEEITGLTRAEAVGRPVWDVLFQTMSEERKAPAAYEYLRASTIESLGTGQAPWLNQLREMQVQRPDGTRRWVQAIMFPIETDKGFVIGSISRDITERKRAEEALARERILLRTVIDNLPDAIYAKDVETRKVLVNPADVRNTGLQAEAEVLGKTDWELFPKEVAAGFYADDQAVLQTGAPVLDREELLVNASGEQRWLLTSKIPLRDESGQITGLVGIGRDITELRRAEEETRSLAKFPAENPFPVLRLSQDGTVLYANAASEVLLRDWGCTVGSYVPTFWRGLVTEVVASQSRRTIDFSLGEQTYTCVVAPVLDAGYVNFYASDITERKRAEEQLRYQADLLANVSDAIVASDTQYRITAWNAAAEAIYGWKAEEVLGRYGLEITRTEWLGADANEMRRTIAEMGQWHGQVTQQRKDGTRVPVEVASIVLHDEAGRITGYVSVNRDITERKRAEEALARERILLRTLIDNLPDAIYVKDAEGRKVLSNPADVHSMGLQAEAEVLGKTDREVYPPEVAASFDAHDQSVLQTGTPLLGYEEPLVDASGECRWWLTSKLPLRDESGQVTGLVGIGHDITERKRAEGALRESEGRFRSLYERAPLGYQSLDAQGCLIDVNQAWLDLLGYSRDDVIGHWFGDFLAPQEVDSFRQRFPRFKAAGEVHVDVEMVQRAGSTIIVHIDGRIGHDEHGQFKQGHCILHDITERKRAEEEQQRLFDQVRAAQEQLRQLASYLQAGREEERTRIARELHDEFGQALTALKMDLAWLARRLGPQQLELREKTRSMSDLVSTTIQAVRRVATELRPGMLDDLGLAAAVEWQAQEFAERTGIALQMDPNSQDLSFGRDLDTILFRIFQEALTNVAQHAQATQVHIELKQEQDSVTLIVRDNGRGITASQISDPRSLGLTGMRERARTWGGEVTLESHPGVGTTVCVRIPLVAQSAE